MEHKLSQACGVDPKGDALCRVGLVWNCRNLRQSFLNYTSMRSHHDISAQAASP